MVTAWAGYSSMHTGIKTTLAQEVKYARLDTARMADLVLHITWHDKLLVTVSEKVDNTVQYILNKSSLVERNDLLCSGRGQTRP